MSEVSAEYSRGLYQSSNEKDACGIGMLVNSNGVRSHKLLQGALQILTNLSHRGAQGSDGRTSDGAGIQIEIPHSYFLSLPELADVQSEGDYAVGMVFTPGDDTQSEACQQSFNEVASRRGLRVLGWRRVPVCSDVLGEHARALEPRTFQVFIAREERSVEQFDQDLYLFRRIVEKKLRRFNGTRDPATGKVVTQFYVSSLSAKTIVYKGLMLPQDLANYYTDLQSPGVLTAFALVHSRFSTNTLPAWELAQPFRNLCHNGEINTVRGNLNAMRIREAKLAFQLNSKDSSSLLPLVGVGQSDSASLDQAIEVFMRAGLSIAEAMMCLVPEPWEENLNLPTALREFYRHRASRMEPWDGPAALCFTDGTVVGTTLDRNGLRPCRYQVMDDGTVIAASEAGCVEWSDARVLKRGRLGPGEMLLVDLERKEIFEGRNAKIEIAGRHPFQEWNEKQERTLLELAKNVNADSLFENGDLPRSQNEDFFELLWRFGYSYEDIRSILTPMFEGGEEAMSSMGNDTPLAILSDRPQLLYRYFRQIFAQVTNPPIDPIRESLVMSLTTYLGTKGELIESHNVNAPLNPTVRVRLKHPFLSSSDLGVLGLSLPLETLSITFHDAPLETAVERLCLSAAAAVRAGIGILVLSDRAITKSRKAMPALLAMSAVHQSLVDLGLRSKVSLVVETGEAREVHHFACLLAFGADALSPYVALQLAKSHDSERGPQNYIQALNKGLLKVMSKMGISTLASYRGSQLFEVMGLSDAVVDRYFKCRRSRIGGIDIETIEQEIELRHQQVDRLHKKPTSLMDLSTGGDIHYRANHENHLWDPMTIASLQIASREKSPGSFQEFSRRVKRSGRQTLRGHLHPKTSSTAAIALDEVESAASIVKRFTTGAMSFGAISKEAHESLAIAMNQMGAKSNSGEGGESAGRFSTAENSAIKQVASARFGVTTNYLVNARELQIKMAQGAKPGEGGQLPGHKVDKVIAGLRYSIPGVTLISPPPHHDIYSIEDLAQLIFDLKSVNPKADVSVKLVSNNGIGTVAAGVAKAHADKITISGDGGGTGASPLSSIKYAGLPWEMGLAEVHQTLVMNGLRNRVRLETDGQLRNGLDVVVAAALGAEEFGFSTAPLIVQGCLMMRKCHLNTCPVGVATQDPELRAKFLGKPEHLINYFFFIAEEVRELLSRLGLRSLGELVGRVDLLEFVRDETHWKASHLDLSKLLEASVPLVTGTKEMAASNMSFALSSLDQEIAAQTKIAIETGKSVQASFHVRNTDRAVGTRLSGDVARKYGETGLPRETVQLSFAGSSGQSFAAFLAAGLTLRLVGETNDYLGKGLSGGTVVVRPFPSVGGHSEVIAGNTCLYGATSGTALIAGFAGERFAVRNSGATAVVEGVGDHGCEYMTGGTVVVLGKVGRNFAAGMSGGVAYIFDEDSDFRANCNTSMVELQSLGELHVPDEVERLYRLIRMHWDQTGSLKAEKLLIDWSRNLDRWIRVMPLEFGKILLAKTKTMKSFSSEQAVAIE